MEPYCADAKIPEGSTHKGQKKKILDGQTSTHHYYDAYYILIFTYMTVCTHQFSRSRTPFVLLYTFLFCCL